MTWHARLRHALSSLLLSPIGELSRAERWARDAIDLVRHCAAQLHRDRASQMAAALTYHTLFSLLPTLVVVLVVMQSFVSDDERARFQDDAVGWLVQWLQDSTPPGMSEAGPGLQPGTSPGPGAVSDPPAAVSMPSDPPPAAEGGAHAAAAIDPAREADDQKHREFQEMRNALGQRIREQIEKLETVNFGSIGVIGVLVLLYGTTKLLGTIERSFNTIYGTDRARPLFTRLPLYYTVITISPLVLLAGRWLQGRLGQVLEADAWTNWLVGPMALLSPLITTWLVLALMYALVPNTKVRLRPAAIGGFVAAVLWVIAIELLRGYVARASTGNFYGALYGALGLLPLFLLWLWLTWVIILFGLELAFVLQTLRGRQWHEEQARRASEPSGDPLWVVAMMAHVGRRFADGRTIDDDDLSEALQLPVDQVQRLARQLGAQGLLHELDGEREGGYALARPPDRIRVADLLELGRSRVAAATSGAPGAALLARLAQVQQDAADDTTLAMLLAMKAAPAPVATITSDAKPASPSTGQEPCP